MHAECGQLTVHWRAVHGGGTAAEIAGAMWPTFCSHAPWTARKPRLPHRLDAFEPTSDACGPSKGKATVGMRIAQIAPLQLAVPPANYGGTERCIYNLTEALVMLGHDVTLFATGDSHTSARLVASVPHAINFDPETDVVAYHIAHLTEVYRQASQFDIIHSHLDSLTLPFAAACPTPTAITLHGRLDTPEARRVLRANPAANYIAISESQRRQVPDVNWTGTIHHAVNLDSFTFYPEPGDYLAFVGRMSPQKGPVEAIRIAKMTGVPLKIAAKVDASERDFFETVVRPLLDDPLIEWLGAVDEQHKQALMGHALAVVLPINWPEPFGMVFIEALAVGTPVLTCPRGSVPELLKDGVTGFIRETPEELAEVVGKIGRISRRGCREYVRKKFDVLQMALKYVNAYSAVLQRRKPFKLLPEPADEVLLS